MRRDFGRGDHQRRRFDDRPCPVKIGEEYDVKIQDVGSKGDGITRVENFVVFVNGASKGDECRIRIKEVSSQFAIADKVEGAEGKGEQEETNEEDESSDEETKEDDGDEKTDEDSEQEETEEEPQEGSAETEEEQQEESAEEETEEPQEEASPTEEVPEETSEPEEEKSE